VKRCFFLLFGSLLLGTFASAQRLRTPQESLAAYRASLDSLRREWPTVRPLPRMRFFLFGMGHRRKMVYQNGTLFDARTGAVIRRWNVLQEYILPADYTVLVQDDKGRWTMIRENQTGVLLDDGKGKAYLTQGKLNLPSFRGKKYASILRVLHHEVLMNVVDGQPVPNFFVYQKPWLRDASLMAMVLKHTRNLDLLRDWVLSLRDPFDRNNHGLAEPDNLGQALFLASLVADKHHPLVAAVLDSVKRFEKKAPDGSLFLEGKTDYALHPVYQTKWMKFGLGSLGLPDPYRIPKQYDSYSSLFWWDFREEHVPGNKFDAHSGQDYPYLVWAEDHFYGEKRASLGTLDYPLTWEANASDARYAGLTVLDPALVGLKLAAPHTWHAAELFLLLLER
jgi:hypothetical protein